MDDSRKIAYFEADVDRGVNTAFDCGFNQVYFVWWNQPFGWYGITLPSYFAPLMAFGRISVYGYAHV